MAAQPLMAPVDPASDTKGREMINRKVMPSFASRFKDGDVVYGIGKHQRWNYTAFFNNPTKFVQYQTTDIAAGEQPDIVDDILNSKLADSSAEGVVYVGMNWDVEKIDAALAQIRRILKPGGLVFIDYAGKGDTRGGRTFEFGEAISLTEGAGFIIDEIYISYGPIQPGIPWYTDGPPIAYFMIARKPTT